MLKPADRKTATTGVVVRRTEFAIDRPWYV